MEGVLYKWTNYYNGWQPRWFVLDGGVLSYYDSKEDVRKGSKGSLKMAVCEIQVCPNDDSRLELVIPGEQHFYLRTACASERQSWVVALGSAKACLTDSRTRKEKEIMEASDSLRSKMSEMRLYYDLMTQQVSLIRDGIQERRPDVQRMSEASSLLSATCDTFVRALEECVHTAAASVRPTTTAAATVAAGHQQQAPLGAGMPVAPHSPQRIARVKGQARASHAESVQRSLPRAPPFFRKREPNGGRSGRTSSSSSSSSSSRRRLAMASTRVGSIVEEEEGAGEGVGEGPGEGAEPVTPEGGAPPEPTPAPPLDPALPEVAASGVTASGVAASGESCREDALQRATAQDAVVQETATQDATLQRAVVQETATREAAQQEVTLQEAAPARGETAGSDARPGDETSGDSSRESRRPRDPPRGRGDSAIGGGGDDARDDVAGDAGDGRDAGDAAELSPTPDPTREEGDPGSNSDRGSAGDPGFDPEQPAEGDGRRGAGDHQGDDSGAEKVETFFSVMAQRFSDAELEDERGIHVEPFLRACASIVPVLDKLGPTAFAPVKLDFVGNIRKITQKYETDREAFPTLQSIVGHEVESGTATLRNSTSEALLWLKRGLKFLLELLTEVREGQGDLHLALSNAYGRTLRRYHGWVVRGVFALALRAAPALDGFLAALTARGGDATGAAFRRQLDRDLDAYLGAMRAQLAQLDGLYESNGLESDRVV